MVEIKKAEQVPYSTTQLYDLVCSLEKYPEFLPWVQRVIVAARSPNKISATVEGTKLGVSFAVSIVYMLHPNSMIEVRIPSGGPFRRIDGLWRFGQAATGSVLSFALTLEFSNMWARWTLGPLIKREIAALLKEFSAQAKKIYH